MPTPDELAKAAEAAKKKAEKPLPALVSPMTRLDPAIRQMTAQYCKEQDKSFSVITEQMWVELLKKLGKLKADFKLEPRKAAAAGVRVKLAASEAKVTDLERQLAELKASKK